MRVVELSQRFSPAVGGVEATLEELVVRLRTAGVDVEVLTTDLERSRPFSRRNYGPNPQGIPVRRFRAVRVAPLPLGLGIVAPRMLATAVRSAADLIHAHAFGYFPTWVGAAVRRLRSIPLVITTHADPGRGLPFSNLYHRSVVRGTLRYADRVIVQSEREAGLLRGLGVPPEKIVGIPTGIALEEFPGRKSPGSEPTVRLLSVGRLDREQKDLSTLMRALARLPRSLAPHLELVGDDWGGLAPARELATTLGVVDRLHVSVSPPRSRVLDAYRRADIFVLSSRFESFPRVLLEAMAAGLPIVASRVGGVEEAVSEGSNALLVPPGDPGALAEAIAILGLDATLRERFGRMSRQRAEQFDWSVLLPRYLTLFEELVRGRSTG